MYMYLVKFAMVSDIIEKLLKLKFKGKSIADVLDMTVDEAYEFSSI